MSKDNVYMSMGNNEYFSPYISFKKQIENKLKIILIFFTEIKL